MAKKEKQPSAAGKQFLLEGGMIVLLEAALYGAMLLLLALMIDKAVLQPELGSTLLYVSWAIAAFFAAAGASIFVKRRVLAVVMGAQGAMLALLLAVGWILFRVVDWPSFFIVAAIAFLAAFFSSFIFLGRKGKKFQKNVSLRLKKK